MVNQFQHIETHSGNNLEIFVSGNKNGINKTPLRYVVLNVDKVPLPG
ncbi:MAG: hypothetical protein ACWA44_12900 [Thiotrichales bacterium]